MHTLAFDDAAWLYPGRIVAIDQFDKPAQVGVVAEIIPTCTNPRIEVHYYDAAGELRQKTAAPNELMLLDAHHLDKIQALSRQYRAGN